MPSENSALWINRLGYLLPSAVILLLVVLGLPAIQQSRDAARRTQSQNYLKLFGLGLHNYHDTYRMLPPGGTFDSTGTGHHGWMTFLDPFLASSPFYSFVDFNVPWDDPLNVDVFLQGSYGGNVLQNPAVTETISPDGFRFAHYSANQNLMYRNSSRTVSSLGGNASTTILLADANGSYVPFGYPYNWRDVSLGLAKSTNGIGCPVRDFTMVLLADGSVRSLDNKIDSEVAITMAGQDENTPTADLTAKQVEPYRCKDQLYWKHKWLSRSHKMTDTFRLSPDSTHVIIDFESGNPETSTPDEWLSTFRSLNASEKIEHVELKGQLRAIELTPFVSLPRLKQLTISAASISGDKESILASLPKDVIVD